MPTLEKLYKQDPESLPFRQPVDPVLLLIPVSQPILVPYRLHVNWPIARICNRCNWQFGEVNPKNGLTLGLA